MPDTPEYFDRYDNLHMTRNERGVLEVAMHTDGGPVVWNGRTHRDYVDAFYEIGRDRRNRVIINLFQTVRGNGVEPPTRGTSATVPANHAYRSVGCHVRCG